MKKENVKLDVMKLVVLTRRTNNISEADPSTAKILACVQEYFHNNIAESIPNKVNPGRTLCCYTEYESDHTGDYTYAIGEEVSSFDNTPDTLVKLIIPAQSYTKFTNGPGAMPDVVISAWQNIWKMTDVDFGGKRSYQTDFEVYDERASDHSKVTLDIYIGLH